MLVKGEQSMLAVPANMTHEAHEPVDNLRVGLVFIDCAGRAHINLELQTMKRMSPRAHLRIDESVRAANAKTRDVNVMIHQLLRIDIVESAFHQIRRLNTELAIQLFGLSCEGAADGMNETHFSVLLKTHHRAQHCRHELALAAMVHTKHVSANYRERSARLNYFRHRYKHFAFCRSHKVNFELDT